MKFDLMVEAMEFGENNLWLMIYGWNWRCLHIHMALVQLDRHYPCLSALASVGWVDTRRNILEVLRKVCMIQEKLCRLIA
jgi:hypothetical protein